MQVAKTWRRQPSNLRLEGSRCTACGHLMLPQAPCCAQCRSDLLEPFAFSGKATLFAVTTVYEAPHNFVSQVPYLAGLVKLEEGLLLPAMLTDMDPEETKIGMALEMVTRRLLAQGETGPIVYAYKFAPVSQ